MRQSASLIAVPLIVAVLASVGGCAHGGPPHSPTQALRGFEIHPDFEIDLFVSEPEIVDPVAMAFGPDGRIWVAENSGYPLDSDGGRGRVKLLEDRDKDGVPDSVSLFADGLSLPTGVMPWKEGVLVTDAPDVLFLADTDGDGRADRRESVLSGFARTNPQHTVSSPVYGLDNWIYLAHEGSIQSVVFADEFGDKGTEIHFPGEDAAPRVPVAGRCVRFRPDSLQLELLAGSSQYGIGFTEWGDVLTHNNTYHARHEVIPARYLQRNPNFRTPKTAQNVFEGAGPAPVHPITVQPRFELLSGIGQMTSAAGLTRYLGGAFPGYEDLAFVGESVHNVVHADRWRSEGATFVARPVSEGREFLASRDAWFRPVNFTVGPDGALYVIDYYRRVIEHPEWTSAETYNSADLYDGDDRGRIWRVTPKGGLPLVAPRLRDLPASDLVARLGSPNHWVRMTVQQLLVQRDDPESVAHLEALSSQDDSPLARLHALWALEGMGRLADDAVWDALESSAAGVRRNAIRLAEPRFRADPSEWSAALLPLERDQDAKVRLQLLLTLGEAASPSLLAVRERMLLADIEDEWFQVAALTWPDPSPQRLLDRLLAALEPGRSAERVVESVASSIRVGTGQFAATVSSLSTWDEWRQAAVLRGLRRGMAGRTATATATDRDRERLLDAAGSADQAVRRAAMNLLEAIGLPRTDAATGPVERAAAVARDSGHSAERRADAVRLIAIGDPLGHLELFRELIRPDEPDVVQSAAVEGLGRAGGDGAANLLLERWSQLAPAARSAAGDLMTVEPALAGLVVGALEKGVIEPWMLEFRSRRRLLMHSDPALRNRARAALAGSDRDREGVVERYRAALAQYPGDADNGRVVYERDCADCHTLAGRGREVGPDLGTVRTRPALNLLNDILLPSESISQTYESYVVELTGGDVVEGVLGNRGPGFIALRREGGEEEVISSESIASIRVARLSAMPSDLETRVSPEEMADLIRYIRSADVGGEGPFDGL